MNPPPDCRKCRFHAIRRTGTGAPIAVCAHPRLLAALHIGPQVNVGPTGLLMNIAPRVCEKYHLFEAGEPAPLPPTGKERR